MFKNTPGRTLIPVMALVVMAIAAAVTIPAWVFAQADPTLDAAIQLAFTQTAEAEGISTEAFGQTVDAAVMLARTATAQAGAGEPLPTETPPPPPLSAEEMTATQIITDATATAAAALQVDVPNAPVVTAPDAPNIAVLTTLGGHNDNVNAVDISADGRIASAGADGTVRVFSIGADGATTADPLVLEHGAAVLDVAFNPAADEIISTDEGGVLYRWDATTGEALPIDDTITVIGDADLPDVDGGQGALITGFAADGTRFATFDFNGLLGVWQYPDVAPSIYPAVYNFGLVNFATETVAYTAPDAPGTVQVAPLDDISASTQTFTFEAEFAEPIAFNADGTRLLILGDDGESRVVDLTTGETLFSFAYTGYGLSAFSPDGTLIADGGTDGSLTLFDGNTGDRLVTLPGHSAPIAEVTFSDDSTRIASGAEDDTVIVWQLGSTADALIAADGTAPTPLPEGFPPITEADVLVAEQVFEGGRMFWVQPVNQIWVMVVQDEGAGQWLVYEDTFDETQDAEVDPSLTPPEEGLIQPVRGFGKLWRENPDVQEALGWGVTPEFGYTSQYRYVPGGEIVDGEYVAGPGFHVLFSLESEAFRFNEEDGTWQLGAQ